MWSGWSSTAESGEYGNERSGTKMCISGLAEFLKDCCLQLTVSSMTDVDVTV